MKNRRGKTVLTIAAVAILALAIGQVQAVTVNVPNGDFETLYKPGTNTLGVVSTGGWTQGVGPDCPIDSGTYEFDDAITGANTENASVTVTKAEPTGDATVITMTLAVNNADDPSGDAVTDAMTIDVYDDSCLAAKAAGPVEIDSTDIDDNCITDFKDFALMAATWLDDYTLTEPVPK